MKTLMILSMILLSNITFSQTFAFVEEMPVFAGCENIIDSRQKCECTKNQFANYIESKLRNLNTGSEMVVNIGIVIDGFGIPTNLELIGGDSLSDETRNSIIESIDLYEDGIKFEPGRNNGRVVNVKMIIPIRVFASL